MSPTNKGKLAFSLSALLGQFLSGALSKLSHAVIISSSGSQFTQTLRKEIGYIMLHAKYNNCSCLITNEHYNKHSLNSA